MKRILDFRFSIFDYPVFVNPKSKIQNQKLLMLAGLFFFVSSGIAWACPLCKEILTDPGQVVQKLSLAKGYAVSILLLLGVPALLIGGVTLLVVRSHRRKPLG